MYKQLSPKTVRKPSEQHIVKVYTTFSVTKPHSLGQIELNFKTYLN